MSRTTRSRLVAVLGMLLCGALGAWAFTGLTIRSSISDFIPVAEGEEDLEDLTRALADAPASRTIALTIGPTDPETAARAAGLLGARLREIDGLTSVEDGAPEDIDRALYELYFPRRYAFFAMRAEDVELSDEALRERARQLRATLTGPTAMLVRRIAPEDPLQAFPQLLFSLRGEHEGSGPRLVDEHLVVDDPSLPEDAPRTFGVVLCATEGTTFSADVQEPVLLAIEAAWAEVQGQLGEAGASLTLEQASVHRFAVRAERRLRADTERIGTLSTVAIVLLFLVLFRGPRYLVLGGLPLLSGTVIAVASCRLVFGGVHGITFAFGSALLGVAIDFTGHYVGHHVLEPEPAEGGLSGPERTMRRLWPGLLLGASTTVLGLLGLGLTSLPGMQELALFSASGVFGALIGTRLLVPPFMPERPEASRLHRALAARLSAMFDALRARPGFGWIALIAALVISVVGLPQLSFVDDLRALNETDPALGAEDRRVRARVAQGDAGRFAVALGDTDEAALLHAEAMTRALSDAVDAGELGSFRSITTLLRSRATQAAVEAAVTGDPSLPARMNAALEAEGFVPSMFEPFAASLAEHPEPLDHATLIDGPLATLARPFRLEVPADEAHPSGRVAYLALLSDVRDAGALDARLEAVEGALLFDQAAYLRAAYATFRVRAMELVLGGLLVVLALCWGRYRNLRLALAAVAPAFLASSTTLACVALSGEPANLMHLVACLLVLSMGEDYAVFLLESRDDPEGPATTMVGILIACATTVLSFGLLAFSSHPALRALGLVTSLGVLLSLLLAPLVLLLVKPSTKRSAADEPVKIG